jgi:hypothetical protein
VIRRRLLGADKGFNVHGFVVSSPFARPEHTEVVATGLRLAGVPESEPAQAK